MVKIFIYLIILCYSSVSLAEMVVTYRNSESINDTRFNYEVQLLALALDKTTPKYGSYLLKPSPRMNAARSIYSAETKAYENYFILASFKYSYSENMMYVPIPLQRGIVGYRVFLTTKQGEFKLNLSNSVEDLKKLKIVQGKGWQDVDILKSNGFNITTLNNYESMFQFLSHHRADIFPRGVSEYGPELAAHQFENPNLLLDQKYVLYYKFPRFFYTHKDNNKAFKRINEGLEMAWKDGSFIALWKQYHEEAILKANLPDKSMIELNNPEMKHMNHDISQYMYTLHD